MTNEEPKAELARWKAERESYPGWLVVPSRNRSRLSHAIEQSLHSGSLAHGLTWDKLSDWPVEERLTAWAELNWRMERALLPMRPDWVGKINGVLRNVVPFPELTSDPWFSSEAKDHSARTGLRWAWTSLAIGALRHYREFRNADQFGEWHTRLGALDSTWDDVHHQRAYQQALWHVTFLADDRALEVLGAWQASRGADPYWLARKAGLLAELGRMEEAGRLWNECLGRLQGANGSGAPFFATTRESAVRSAVWMQQDRWTPDPTDAVRIQSLFRKDGWNYWNELSELSKPDIEYRERCEKAEKDDNAIYFFGALWEPMAAVQFFRLSEELGEALILRTGGINRISGIAGAADGILDDLGRADERLAGSMVMRARYESLWEKRFDQAHIACLTDDLVADMTAACENAFRLAEDGEEPSIFLLCALLRLIHRRLMPELRRIFFIRLLKLGDGHPVKANRFASGALEKVIEEIGRDLHPAEIKDVLPEVLAFPLSSEVGMDEHFWPEPAYLPIPDLSGEQFPQSLGRIDELIERVPGDRRPLIRLSYLFECGVMPKDASEKLARKLWAGSSDDLPDVSPLLPPILLRLPAPEPGQAERALAEHFLKSPPPSLRTPTGGISFGGSDWFRDLANVSKPYRRARDAFISWAPAQAETLFAYAETWWKDEGQELLQKRRSDPLGFARHPRLYGLKRSLARAIAPNLSPGSEIGKVRLPRLLTEIEECGYPILSALPLLMRFKVANSSDVEARLIAGLRSSKRETLNDALWGIIHWVEFQKEVKLPTVPHRLVEQLLIYLAARADGENAAEVVGTIEAILAHNRSIFSKRAGELLGLALDALQVRAAYPETWYQRDGMRYAQTVDLRRNAVLLASAAHKAGISDDESVQYWLEVGRSDPLTVVKQAMKEDDF